ncbi:MAG: phospholipase D-like domain-containing protein [Marmoricola sp.]
MSLLLKAFPHGRPYHSARSHVRTCAVVAATFLALVVTLLPLAGPASAGTVQRSSHQVGQAQPGARETTAREKKKQREKKKRQQQRNKKKHDKPRPKPKPKKKVGQPPRTFVVRPTSYFTYPNGGRKERQAIRQRVLKTIASTWGGPRTSIGTPRPENGTIRIATWSFDDWDVAEALVSARKRGVSVQVVAAKAANKDHPAWRWLSRKLGQKLYRPGYPATRETVSFARSCRGACRGPGGTAHAKYFLFDKVGPAKARKISFQTSSNLTYMAWQGQWNQAQVYRDGPLYDDYLAVFRQARLARGKLTAYHVKVFGKVVNYFFPRPRATVAQDPAMQVLNHTRCMGAGTSRSGRTKVRVIQYAVYGDRGVWLAKKLRGLWKAGCDVAIIYSVSSRPVLSILRNPAGRGPIPMRQSVEKDYYGNIVKYNHSKWMTIIGNWGSSRESYQTFSGSANWANLAFGDDEQMQRISSVREALRHNAAFKKTWRQPSSSEPSFARVVTFGRAATVAPFARDVPLDAPAFGTGVFRYMTPD